MDTNQGFFSLVQYSEYPERAEYVNIGIVLYARLAPFVFARFSQRPRRVRAAFNVSLGAHFDRIQESLMNRLESEFRGGWKKEAIERFAQQRSGKIRLSPLRSVLVEDPHAVLDELFLRLVGEVKPQVRAVRARTKLATALKDAGVDSLLEKPSPVRLSSGVRIDAQYGYQNGALNLVEAVSLAGDPDKALNKVGPKMIEGSLLHQETFQSKRLVVVADEAESQSHRFIEMLSSQMEQHHVRFYTLEQIGILAEDIRINYVRHH